MKHSSVPAPVRRMALALLSIGVAAGTLGATSYQWAPVGKDDRIPSIADCRDAGPADRSTCDGVALPRTSADAVEVAPGLSVVGQVER